MLVLVATSFLDKLLMDTLAAFFIEKPAPKALLSGFNAPFGSLHADSRMPLPWGSSLTTK